MNRYTLITPLILILASCSYLTGERQFESKLDGLLGKPANYAFSKLGMPNSEGKIADNKFYIWASNGIGFVPDMTTTNGFGTVGSDPFSYSQTSFGGGSPIQTHCTIRLFVNGKNIITRWDIDGSAAGCSGYMQRMGY